MLYHFERILTITTTRVQQVPVSFSTHFDSVCNENQLREYIKIIAHNDKYESNG